ncbi:MAG: ubiquinone/menaquinone biosynthesis C-methylase UbiE [Alteromonas naphthalenivorans]|jgi:ubiquinone/menaquinone biosynthesis C-methylase UbiE
MKAEFDQFAKNYRGDQTEGHYFLTGENSHYFAQLKAEKLKEWLPAYFKGAPKTILDFGCGDGLMTHEVKKQFPQSEIHGVDNSPESIKIAKKNYPDIHYHVSTNNLSVLKKQSYDVVLATHVFHHIYFNEHEHYIKELMNVLKPGGVFVFYELNPLNPGTWYIFRNHPMEVNATMLKPWYARKLVANYGKTDFISYAFFPHFLSFFRPLEKYITKVPFGGLYTIILKKESK